MTTSLPLLAHRSARERLHGSAIAAGSLPRTVPEVLFVFTHSAARSQLAAALLEHRGITPDPRGARNEAVRDDVDQRVGALPEQPLAEQPVSP